jgi:P-type Ca2+ transporter type 2C
MATAAPPLLGLSVEEAAHRLQTEGANELPTAKRSGIIGLIAGVLREPMLLLLVACGAIYFLLGDVQEALLLLTFVFVVIGITLYQEHKTERALDALRDLSSPRALVIRDGREYRVPGREVVPGDLVILAEGDRVPADAVLLAGSNLRVDESLLTGESVAVRKQHSLNPEDEDQARPGGDGTCFVYSGTLVVGGQATALVRATGAATEIGAIGKALESLEPERTRLQREIDRLVLTLALVGGGLCAVVVIVYGFSRADWLGGFLAGITLAMAMLPEEFPVVLTVFLALGAWRLSQNRVLTRRMPAVETLGSVTALCVDKTGTLTQNRMSVARLDDGATSFSAGTDATTVPDELHELMEFAMLASKRRPFDPMEIAFREFGAATLSGTEHLHEDWELVAEYPLTDDLLSLSRVWQMPSTGQRLIAVKGAPEAVADLCHFDPPHVARLHARLSVMTGDGLRVLGVARGLVATDAPLPTSQHDFDFEFLGLVGLADPVRDGVRRSVAECRSAGIRVVMITGDYPGTALAIARQVGLDEGTGVITGTELEAMSDEVLSQRIRTTTIFARTVPEQKLRLVQALKAIGEVVGMTGDGVNDAPALKAAGIGIAMGGRGTDVAREASDIVLTDDDFTSIVTGVRLGRRIYDNLKKAMAYILAVHVPIAGMSLVPVLFGSPLVLMPVHIAFLELIIDPACSVVFEAEKEESTTMSRRPRPLGERLFSRRTLAASLTQGLVVLAVVGAVYALSLARGAPEGETRALTFTTLVVANVGLILTNLSWSRSMLSVLRGGNRALWWVIAAAAVFLTLLLTLPPARSLFGFSPLGYLDVLIALGAGLFSVAWFETLKLRSRGTPAGG